MAGLGVALRPPRSRPTLPERPWTPPGIPEEYTQSHPVLGHHRADMPGRSGAECRRLLEAGSSALAEPRRLGRGSGSRLLGSEDQRRCGPACQSGEAAAPLDRCVLFRNVRRCPGTFRKRRAGPRGPQGGSQAHHGSMYTFYVRYPGFRSHQKNPFLYP